MFAFLFLSFIFSCSAPPEQRQDPLASGKSAAPQTSFPISLEHLSESQYPDDPDLVNRAPEYDTDLLGAANLAMTSDSTFDLEIQLPNNGKIAFSSLDLDLWIPTIPDRIRGDEYLSLLAVVNQEWNRNQVAFRGKEFITTDPSITRVDIARNCLNAYLWEVIAYTTEAGNELPLSHGWFNFPKTPYHAFFERRNGLPFAQFSSYLENWKDPANEPIDRAKLRTVIHRIPTRSTDHSNVAYPLTGERARKRKEVLHPVAFGTMHDLCSDQTTFATFSPPGIYVRADPRHTQLGRFDHLVSASMHRVEVAGANDGLVEIDLLYADADGKRRTHFVVGGFDPSTLPVLPEKEANSAWASSMGFGNHPFYESYAQHLAQDTRTSPYYAFLTDGDGNWLDSHAVGIDGPLLHFTDDARHGLNVWLLSFERHALVGHVVLEEER